MEHVIEIKPNPITYLRQKMNLSQAQLAKDCGLTRQYISRLEQGMYPKINTTVLNYLARGVGMKPEDMESYYAQWKNLRRQHTCVTRDIPKLIAPVGNLRVLPYFRYFRQWRENNWPSRTEFCVDMCAHIPLVEIYENGKTRAMPLNLREALESVGLIGEGFRVNAR